MFRVSFKEKSFREASQVSDRTFLCPSVGEIASERSRVMSVCQFFFPPVFLLNCDPDVAVLEGVYMCVCSTGHNKLASKSFPLNTLSHYLKTIKAGEMSLNKS